MDIENGGRDSSYNVRAAALASLARLDTANRRALVREGLTTPSYRDAIQTAALVAIARANDTALIADVQSGQMLGVRFTPTLFINDEFYGNPSGGFDAIAAILRQVGR